MSDRMKEQIREVEKITQRAPDARFMTEGDDFLAAVKVDGFGAEDIEGYEHGYLTARASSFEEAMDLILGRLRAASNTKAQTDLAAYNLAKTEAVAASQSGKVSPFHKAILEGRTLEEAAAIARGDDPDKAPDLSPAQERELIDGMTVGSTADPASTGRPEAARIDGLAGGAGGHKEGGVLGA